VLHVANADPNGSVDALAASSAGLHFAHAPGNQVALLDGNGQATAEATLDYPATGFAQAGGALYLATSEPATAGAGDVFSRTPQGWAKVLDGDQACAVVAATQRGDAYAFGGDPAGVALVHRLRRGSWQQVATLGDAIPSVAAEHGRTIWVGAGPADPAGGPARLFSGIRSRFSEHQVTFPGLAPGANEGQRVEALLSVGGSLVVALGTWDLATGLPVRGQVVVLSGRSLDAVASAGDWAGDAPNALAWADGSLMVGTASGRLLHLAGGQWTDEPGLPQNAAVNALVHDPATGLLLVGVQTPGGGQILSRVVKAAPPPTPPVAPSTLAANAASATQVDLTWADNSADETGFALERSPAGMDQFTAVGAPLAADSTAASDTSVAADTSYDYRVVALKGTLRSTPSNVATVKTPASAVAPTAPAGLAATAASATQVDLVWTDTSNNETGFLVQRSLAAANAFAQVGQVLPAGSTAYSDTSAVADTSYDYRVVAVNGALASAPSNVATVKTPAVLGYVKDVKPILAAKSCAACHAAGRPYVLSVGLSDDAADYASTLKQLDLANAANSELLLRATQTKGHPLALFTTASPEYATLKRWIESGAGF
jgi:fibronectin type 3 domain-containing protein